MNYVLLSFHKKTPPVEGVHSSSGVLLIIGLVIFASNYQTIGLSSLVLRITILMLFGI